MHVSKDIFQFELRSHFAPKNNWNRGSLKIQTLWGGVSSGGADGDGGVGGIGVGSGGVGGIGEDGCVEFLRLAL